MAGGPLLPRSVDLGDSGDLSPGFFIGSTNGRTEETPIKVIGSLGTDRTAQLRWDMPAVAPSGTLKLVIVLIADASTGDIDVNPVYDYFANNASADSDPATDEGTINIDYADVDAEDYMITKINLDGTAFVGSSVLSMDLNFVAAGWGLVAEAYIIPYLVWED